MNTQNMNMRPAGPDVTPNDKLLAAASYVINPLAGILILLMDEYKNRPFPRYHALQSLGFAVAVFVYEMIASVIFCVGSVLTAGLGFLCLWVLLLLPLIPAIYFAYQAYQGFYFEIPMVTKMMQQQGWMPRG